MAIHTDPITTSGVHLPILPGKRTITKAQIEARRANGKKSRGPKTSEGKNISRLNGLRHGVFATVLPSTRHPVLGAQSDLDQLTAELSTDLRPKSGFARVLASVVALDVLRLQRIAKMESAILDQVRFHDYEEREITNARTSARQGPGGTSYEELVRLRTALTVAAGSVSTGRCNGIATDELATTLVQLTALSPPLRRRIVSRIVWKSVVGALISIPERG